MRVFKFYGNHHWSKYSEYEVNGSHKLILICALDFLISTQTFILSGSVSSNVETQVSCLLRSVRVLCKLYTHIYKSPPSPSSPTTPRGLQGVKPQSPKATEVFGVSVSSNIFSHSYLFDTQ